MTRCRLHPWVSCHWTWEEGPWAKLWVIRRRHLVCRQKCLLRHYSSCCEKADPFRRMGPLSQKAKWFSRHQTLSKTDLERVIGHSFWWRDLTLLHTGILFLCVLRGIPTHRSWVRKIRFAPGKGNQKLIAMYSDGAEVWDTKEVGSAPGGALQPSCVQELYSSPSFWCRNEACVMGRASFSKPFSRF